MKRLFMPAIVLAFGLTACAGPLTLTLEASPEVPAAQGTVKVRATDNGNSSIDLVVKHLAPAARISPDATGYVVWVVGTEPGAQPQSVGALKVDNDLKGHLTAITPLHAFRLFITVESSQLVTRPMGRTILSTRLAMK